MNRNVLLIGTALLLAPLATLHAVEKPAQPLKITPANPPNDGILFVDHSKNNRSGHLGHALVQYERGKILAFYPNCSSDNHGHSAVGWMEFKRSEDGGKTWGAPQVLPYSKELFDKSLSENPCGAPDNDGTGEM